MSLVAWLGCLWDLIGRGRFNLLYLLLLFLTTNDFLLVRVSRLLVEDLYEDFDRFCRNFCLLQGRLFVQLLASEPETECFVAILRIEVEFIDQPILSPLVKIADVT